MVSALLLIFICFALSACDSGDDDWRYFRINQVDGPVNLTQEDLFGSGCAYGRIALDGTVIEQKTGSGRECSWFFADEKAEPIADDGQAIARLALNRPAGASATFVTYESVGHGTCWYLEFRAVYGFLEPSCNELASCRPGCVAVTGSSRDPGRPIVAAGATDSRIDSVRFTYDNGLKESLRLQRWTIAEHQPYKPFIAELADSRQLTIVEFVANGRIVLAQPMRVP